MKSCFFLLFFICFFNPTISKEKTIISSNFLNEMKAQKSKVVQIQHSNNFQKMNISFSSQGKRFAVAQRSGNQQLRAKLIQCFDYLQNQQKKNNNKYFSEQPNKDRHYQNVLLQGRQQNLSLSYVNKKHSLKSLQKVNSKCCQNQFLQKSQNQCLIKQIKNYLTYSTYRKLAQVKLLHQIQKSILLKIVLLLLKAIAPVEFVGQIFHKSLRQNKIVADNQSFPFIMKYLTQCQQFYSSSLHLSQQITYVSPFQVKMILTQTLLQVRQYMMQCSGQADFLINSMKNKDRRMQIFNVHQRCYNEHRTLTNENKKLKIKRSNRYKNSQKRSKKQNLSQKKSSKI